ncbi:MAG: hypothetical protein M3N47_14380 [Chloroflexota bacterium]|nr:hypothetical protein [Chloroflexota bacterium]
MRRTLAATAATIAAFALLSGPAQASSGTPYGPPPTASQAGKPMTPPRGLTREQQLAFWKTVRKVVVGAAAIGAFIGGNGLLIWKLRKAGGVWKSAKRVVLAKGKEA